MAHMCSLVRADMVKGENIGDHKTRLSHAKVLKFSLVFTLQNHFCNKGIFERRAKYTAL